MNSLSYVFRQPLHFVNYLLPPFWHRDLSYNDFSGPVPPAIGDLEHLLELYVKNQDFRIHIDFSLCVFA